MILLQAISHSAAVLTVVAALMPVVSGCSPQVQSPTRYLPVRMTTQLARRTPIHVIAQMQVRTDIDQCERNASNNINHAARAAVRSGRRYETIS